MRSGDAAAAGVDAAVDAGGAADVGAGAAADVGVGAAADVGAGAAADVGVGAAADVGAGVGARRVEARGGTGADAAIRDLAPEDIPAVAALARRAWIAAYKNIYPVPEIEAYVAEHYAPARLAPFARPGAAALGGKGAFTVAVLDGALAGFCHAGVRGRPDDFWLHRIYVEPALKGRGLGSAMLSDMEARLRALGARRYSLECHAENASGLAFYSARGLAKLRDAGEDVVLGKEL